MLPRLKEEHPTFRLSQLKQLLKKEWQKSPDNPLNQKILSIIQWVEIVIVYVPIGFRIFLFDMNAARGYDGCSRSWQLVA